MKRNDIQQTIGLLALGVSVISLPFSVKVCHGAVVVFLLNWLAGSDWKQRWILFKENFLLQVFVAFFLFHLVGILYTQNSQSGWFDIEKKLFMLLLPFAIATSGKFEKKEITAILSLFIGACFLGSVYCLIHAGVQLTSLSNGDISFTQIDYLSATPFRELNAGGGEAWVLFSYRALSSGINLHPTYFSLYLAFCIVFLLHLAAVKNIRSTFLKILFWSLIVYFSLFIFMLSSRIIIIGLFILFAIRILYVPVLNRWAKVAAVALLLCIFSSLAYLNPVTRYRGMQEFVLASYRVQPDRVYSTSTEIRNSLWWLSWKSLQNINLLWGEGTGAAPDVIRQTSEHFQIKNSLATTDPHNQYISTFINHGLIGIALLGTFLFMPLYMAWQKRDYLTLAFSILIAITCLTETALTLQKGIMFFALFYSLLIFQYRPYHLSSLQTQTPTP